MSLSTLSLSPPNPSLSPRSSHRAYGVHAGRGDVALVENMLRPSSSHEASGSSSRPFTTSRDDRSARITTGSVSAQSASTSSGTAPRTSPSLSPRGSSRMSDTRSTSRSRMSPTQSGTRMEIWKPDDSRTYHLKVIQHPERTAAIGNAAVLSRLPLSPPLVVQLTVEDADGIEIPAHTDMPFLTAHLWLYSQDGSNPIDLVEGPTAYADRQPALYGTLVSSLHSLLDLDEQPGMFFIFPDVSVRRRGSYTLRVNLLSVTMPPSGNSVMPVGTENPALAFVMTDAFEVVPQTEYVAPPPTPLTNSFHRQGARMYTPFQPR